MGENKIKKFFLVFLIFILVFTICRELIYLHEKINNYVLLSKANENYLAVQGLRIIELQKALIKLYDSNWEIRYIGTVSALKADVTHYKQIEIIDTVNSIIDELK